MTKEEIEEIVQHTQGYGRFTRDVTALATEVYRLRLELDRRANAERCKWNHRVIEKIDVQSGEHYFEIHEVYYESGEIISYTRESVGPFGESEEELKEDLKLLMTAFDHPVLQEEDLPGYQGKK